MTQTKNIIDSRKEKHLSYAERSQISILKKEGYSNRQVASALGRAPQTIHNEVRRGTITQMSRQKQNGKTYDYYYTTYDEDAGQEYYENQRLNCGRRPKWAETNDFIEWADEKMRIEKWSPDATIGFAIRHDLFDSKVLPCTSTLYQWIERGIMRTRNIDLLEKLSRKPRVDAPVVRQNKRILGPSIEERPTEVETRETFGHWEIDTVIGNKTKCEAVLLTLVERQTRFEVLVKISGKNTQSVDQAIVALRERCGDHFETLFKTITSDNGSEFASLHNVLKDSVDVYFSHPYTSWERGTSENQHKFIRRFIPKGKSINDISECTLLRIQRWMNDYPRKILSYRTPHEAFVHALNQMSQAA